MGVTSLLEDRVDEGRERRAVREDDETPEERHDDHDRREPPLLADAQEAPELPGKAHDSRTRHTYPRPSDYRTGRSRASTEFRSSSVEGATGDSRCGVAAKDRAKAP